MASSGGVITVGRKLWFLATAAAVLLTGTCRVAAAIDALLGRPTERSVALSLLATEAGEAAVEWGLSTGGYSARSPVVHLSAGVPAVLVMEPLQSDVEYRYRVLVRPVGAEEFATAVEAGFATQRASNRTFSFAVEADPHAQDNEPAVWSLALANIGADRPDFLLDLGDTFMDEKVGATSYAQLEQTRRMVRSDFFAQVGASVPLFLVNGNHDPELGWTLNSAQPQENRAVWAAQLRQLFFPCPAADAFYSGAEVQDSFMLAPRDGYFAFEWGDALFVALDPFWYSGQLTPKSKDPWFWTLGRTQFDWLQRTLGRSRATFKFVFLHHLVGGSHDAIGRGGLEVAPYYEWGGLNLDGSAGFAARRPGWPMPIQDLLLSHGVTIVFHGHDHAYVKQDLDANGDGKTDLIYQEVPQPSRSNQNTNSAVLYGYRSGVIFPSSGHLRVRVSPEEVNVDYVRAVVGTDTRAGVANGAVQHHYTVAAKRPGRLVNFSVRERVSAGEGTLIVGFAVAGSGSKNVLIRGIGPGLGAYGLINPLPDPALKLFDGEGGIMGSNEDWAPDLAGEMERLGAFALAAGSRDAAWRGMVGATSCTVHVVSGQAGGVALAEVYDAGLARDTAQLVNVSARASVGTGQDILIGGFVIDGTEPLKVLVRGLGPSLTRYGVADVLANPKLELFTDHSLTAANDDWMGKPDLLAAFEQVGAAALDGPQSKDAALILTLAPGVYTAHISGVGGAAGIALVEIYAIH